MFQDALLLKTQLFHTVWPAVDIIPYASMANSSLDMSLGANSSVNYYPVSSESTVSPARCAAARSASTMHRSQRAHELRSAQVRGACGLTLHRVAGGLELRRQLRQRRRQLLLDQRRQVPDCWQREFAHDARVRAVQRVHARVAQRG